MNKVISRLLTFFIGLPVVIAVVFSSHLHHMAALCLCGFAGMFTAGEVYNMLSNKFKMQNKALVLILAALLPVATIILGYLDVAAEKADMIFDLIFVGSILFSLAFEVVTNETFENSNSKILTTTFTLFYASYLFTYLSRMTWLKAGVTENVSVFESINKINLDPVSIYIAYFFLVVYLNDSLAWLFGNLFGKNNKGFIKASPNKSLAGFFGGFLASVASGLLVFFLFPVLFKGLAEDGTYLTSGIVKIVLLSLVMGIVAIFGDLTESVLKRSCEVKDSGNLIPGRGGVLDSVDSVIFAAPVFYLAIKILYLW